MSLLRPTSLRQRLLLISAIVTLLTLGVAGSAFVVNNVHTLRNLMVRDLEVLSVAVGDNCLSSLVFDTPETAEKNLASLRREPQIHYAALYDADGRPFALYRRDVDQAFSHPMSSGEGVFQDVSWLGLGTVEVVRALTLDAKPIGRIFIHAHTDELKRQLRRYAGMVGLLFLGTLTVSLLFALRLHRRVSDPILQLAAKTREISQQGNYAYRISQPDADDEIAALFRGFNRMLGQIERREQDLTHIREHLSQLVDERTLSLDGLVREQRLILEALPLGVIHLKGRSIVRVNPRAVELFGWNEDEMLGMSTEHFYPDREAFEEVGRTGYPQMASGGIYRVDRLLMRKDGGRFWGRLIGQYIDPGNITLGSIWIVDDVGRDKALEEGLRRAREAAEEANRAKDAFLASVSHELRTPLNAVLGFAQLLEGDTRLDGGQQRQVQGIRRAGERLLGLINQVLDLAKIEAGRFEVLPVEWDSGELLQELDGMFRVRAARNGLDLRIECSEAVPKRIWCDAQCVHQILVNLLDNAIKYTERGSVVLRVDFTEKDLILEVEDTGVGLRTEDVGDIFEPFRRVGEARSQVQGVGLGLAISKRLVDILEGSLAVDSVPGRGSRFQVRVPAKPVIRVPGSEETARAEARVTGYRRWDGEGPFRILIVDDEEENREFLREMLTSLGFAVQEAGNGTECLEKAEEWIPDLVLMDLRMPGMDGLEATRALRRHTRLGGIPIVMITAAAFPEDRAQAEEAGCNAHLAKPVTFEALLSALERLLLIQWHTQKPSSDAAAARDVDKLPERQAQRLTALIQTGSVTALRVFAGEMLREGCCPAFAARIEMLADEFDLEGLKGLLPDLERRAGVALQAEPAIDPSEEAG